MFFSMQKAIFTATLFTLFLMNDLQAQLSPPKAKIVPKKLTKHKHTRLDNYYWLNERENPEVVSYVEAENAYTEAIMKPTQALQDSLFEEMKARIKETDMSVPYLYDGYYFYTRYEQGQEYPIYCRKKGNLEAQEEILLNVNELAEGQAYCSVADLELTDDHHILAFSMDTVGRRQYTLHFKDMRTGKILADQIHHVTGSAWSSDNKTLFFSRQDTETLRSFQVYRYVLGSNHEELIYEEKDETFDVGIFRTKSKKYIFISSHTTLADEYRFIEADKPTSDFKMFLKRQRGHEYGVDHYGDNFYVLTNWDAQNFRLMSCPVTKTAKSAWKEVIPHRPDVLLSDIEIFQHYLVVEERKGGLTQLRVIRWADQTEHYIQFEEPTYTIFSGTNLTYETDILRFGYTSLTTPSSTYDYDMNTRQKTLLKQQEVLGGYNPADYKSEFIWATAQDGTKIPISLVYKKGFEKTGTSPLFLYAYGSYGISIDPTFSSTRLSLLNRGFVFAIAHIRGGQELGRQWYENGKMFQKKNTFTDFTDCAEHLIKGNYTSASKLVAEGGSAGGLLMGAILNMKPHLFKAVISAVPFVDVVTTMLDTSIPLTTSEYDEWGNPNKKDSYDYMLSYSPYDQVSAQNYPHILVTTGFHDSQVQYWEPAKWVAKLRTMKTDKNMLLMKTDMSAGHSGKTGRFQYLKDIAFEFAFLLKALEE